MASLPEGFCPTSMQELANAIAARLLISPNQAFTSFAASSVEPSSNVGPWLKDCLQWFFFDDATARYIPQAKGGFDTIQYFTTSGTFVVPDFITQIKVHAWGAGAGASNADTGGAGGGGAYALKIFTVISGQVITITVGSGGAPGGNGGNGGDTVVLTMTAGGGKGNVGSVSGIGGTATGGDMMIAGGPARATQAGIPGDGGASPQGGSGGTQVFLNGAQPGGGGGTLIVGNSGGTGGSGAVLIEY